MTDRARAIADCVEALLRATVVLFERDPCRNAHGPSDTLVTERKSLARDTVVPF